MAVSNCTRACRHCGKTFVRTEKGQPTKFCSVDCRSRYRGWSGQWRCTHSKGDSCAVEGCSQSATVRGYCSTHYHRVRTGCEVDAPINQRGVRVSKPCNHCGEAIYLTPTEAKGRSFCSIACAGKSRMAVGYDPVRDYRRRRRAKILAGDRIDAAKVFERDKWRCHMCGIRTPQRLRGSLAHNAPELDHIVALADGGTHTWGNVACACRKCNGSKGSRSRGQLGLPLAA